MHRLCKKTRNFRNLCPCPNLVLIRHLRQSSPRSPPPKPLQSAKTVHNRPYLQRARFLSGSACHGAAVSAGRSCFWIGVRVLTLLKPQVPSLKPAALGRYICVHLRHLRIVVFGPFASLRTSDFGLVSWCLGGETPLSIHATLCGPRGLGVRKVLQFLLALDWFSIGVHRCESVAYLPFRTLRTLRTFHTFRTGG